jgi:hypothetical protein
MVMKIVPEVGFEPPEGPYGIHDIAEPYQHNLYCKPKQHE